MDHATYKISIGDWSVSSGDDPRTEVLRIETRSGLFDPTSHADIVLYLVPPPKPDLLGQAIGAAADALGLGDSAGEPAFSISVRGTAVKHGDPVVIELANGDRSATVMTATVAAVQSTFECTRIVARTALHTLATTRVNRTYQNQSVKQILSDLAQQAGVDAGEIERGSTYPYLLVHESKSVLSGACELARREGLDLYVDADNHLTAKEFSKSSADHTLYYGIDLLHLAVLSRPPVPAHVTVVGESPSSNQGSTSWPWIAKDASVVKGEAGSGEALLALRDGAVRNKDAADLWAKRKLGASKDAASRGRCRLLGNPAVKLGDAIEIKEAPKPELNGLFKVTCVRHVLDKTAGFITDLDFSGQGGAQEDEGLLGGLGKLAGAVGL
jgi:hypothetical protein